MVLVSGSEEKTVDKQFVIEWFHVENFSFDPNHSTSHLLYTLHSLSAV